MIVLDTHILVWMNEAQEKLTQKSINFLAEATTLIIPSISLWEISMLVHYGRLKLSLRLSEWLNLACGLP
jgi:PIN domain nuclease of toxin-antitoxin system